MGVMFISPISRSTNALHSTELVAEPSPSQSIFCFAPKSRSTLFFSPWTLIVSVVVLLDARQPSLLVPEASVSQSFFFCFASVSILTLFLKGSSANAWVALVPITHPINNTIEGIRWSLNLDSSISYRTFSLYEVG
jgi:hypothetical protein